MTLAIYANFRSHFPRRLHVKGIGYSCLSGVSQKRSLKMADVGGRLTDARAWVYFQDLRDPMLDLSTWSKNEV